MGQTKWQALDDDDFIRKIGETGILRVEQMDRKNWWCCVYFEGEEIWNRTGYKTCKIAKQTALNVYKSVANDYKPKPLLFG